MKSVFTLAGLLFLLGFQLHCERAHAEDDESLRSILKSRTEAQLNSKPRQRGESDDLVRLRLVCETQLAMRIIPISCFALVHREAKQGLVNVTKAASTLDWLGGLCEERARSLASVPTLEFAALPERCQRAIRDRKDDLLYKNTNSDPVSVFRQRF